MAEICVLEWHVHPLRADRWFEVWQPAAERAASFGARSWSLTRSVDDPLHFRQTMIFEDRADFDRYWYSDDISRIREEALNYYNKPLLPSWYKLVAGE